MGWGRFEGSVFLKDRSIPFFYQISIPAFSLGWLLIPELLNTLHQKYIYALKQTTQNKKLNTYQILATFRRRGILPQTTAVTTTQNCTVLHCILFEPQLLSVLSNDGLSLKTYIFKE